MTASAFTLIATVVIVGFLLLMGYSLFAINPRDDDPLYFD